MESRIIVSSDALRRKLMSLDIFDSSGVVLVLIRVEKQRLILGPKCSLDVETKGLGEYQVRIEVLQRLLKLLGCIMDQPLVLRITDDWHNVSIEHISL